MQNSTLVVGGLSEFKENVKPQKSLLEQIESAKSVYEVQELLKVGGKYIGASKKTMRMWAKASAKRISELS
jgi:hypothetical protein